MVPTAHASKGPIKLFWTEVLQKLSFKFIISIADYNRDIDPEHESVTNVVASATLRPPRVSPSPNICQGFSPQILNSLQVC